MAGLESCAGGGAARSPIDVIPSVYRPVRGALLHRCLGLLWSEDAWSFASERVCGD
jgi:hypothetical protein